MTAIPYRQSSPPTTNSGPAGSRSTHLQATTRTARFWDRIAERYARKPVADPTAYQEKLAVTQRYLRPDMKVLEFGCGTGSTALIHAGFVDHITAIDVSGKMIEIARSKAEEANAENIDFRRSSIEEFAAPPAGFDIVLGMSILHLVEDRDAVIAKIHRLLKPGGIFVSSTACIGDMSGIFRVILPIGRGLGFFPRVNIFRATALRRALRQAGFSVDHEWQPGKGKSVFLVAKKAPA